jgi:hypothetical protein
MTRPAPLLVFVLAVTACYGPPPQKEIDAAARQVQQARDSGAATVAPDQMREAEAALDEARRRAQERDYKGALSSASEAADQAQAAVKAVVVAHEADRTAAQAAQKDVQAVLDDARSLRERAGRDRVPAAAFHDVDGEMATAHEGMARVKASLDRGEYGAARQAAGALRSQVAALPTAVREARTKWEADHAKGRRPKAPTRKKRSGAAGPTL